MCGKRIANVRPGGPRLGGHHTRISTRESRPRGLADSVGHFPGWTSENNQNGCPKQSDSEVVSQSSILVCIPLFQNPKRDTHTSPRHPAPCAGCRLRGVGRRRQRSVRRLRSPAARRVCYHGCRRVPAALAHRHILLAVRSLRDREIDVNRGGTHRRRGGAGRAAPSLSGPCRALGPGQALLARR